MLRDADGGGGNVGDDNAADGSTRGTSAAGFERPARAV
jgi:hypothetical protein